MWAFSGKGSGRERARIGRRIAVVAAAAEWLAIAAAPVRAESVDPLQPQFGWQEVWAGADTTGDSWLLYSGATIAPWSKDIYSDGLRLRATGGYGQYSYSVRTNDCGNPGQDACAPNASHKHVDVTLTYTDALVGYQQRFGELTAKAFVGVAMVEHGLSAEDTHNKVSGQDIGVKGMLELWLNLGSQAWTSLDLNYTTAHDTGAARWRAGWRALPTVSIGPEVRYDTNAEDDAGRAGVFARYEWFGGEASVAAGASGSITGGDAEGLEPYATVNVLFQY